MSAVATAERRSAAEVAFPAGGLVLPLAAAFDAHTVGGKAHTLARLIALGVPVPAGIVVTCRARDMFLERSALAPALDEHLAGLHDTGDAAALQRASDAIRALVTARPLPQEVDALLRAGVRSLGSGPFVVRSSAVGEDSRGASFAGQFDSILHVDAASLTDALRACWASCWSAGALAYRRARGIVAAGMAVIVQRQVDAIAAGVLFTRNPDRGSANAGDIVVEYGAGLADKLVAGEIDPGRLYLSRSSHMVTSEVAPAPEHAAARLALTDTLLRELAATALRLERAFGGPQDIEWAVGSDGRLAIVQSRHVTTPCTAGEPATVLWSNANVSENFPEPVSPLLYSIASAGYYHYFRNLGRAFGVSRRRLAAMDGALRTIIGVHGARIYYNLTNIHAVLRMVPFGERLADAFNLFVGAARIADQPAGMRSWRERRSPVVKWLELARIACAVIWQFLFLSLRLRAFERVADEFAARTTRDALDGRTLTELGADLAAFTDIRCHRWKNASLCDTAAMVCYALLRRVLARGGFGDATHTRLLRALPGVPSSQPALRLWGLSRSIVADPRLRALFDGAAPATLLAALKHDCRFASFGGDLEEFLTTWGFRSSGELMLTTPTLEERPEPVIALLKQYISASGESPEENIARLAAERRSETRAVVRGLALRAPVLALVTFVLLRWTQRAVACRERARLKQALLYTRCRRVALRIGEELVRSGRLTDRDDVFMLTWQEIDELCSGRAMFPREVAALVELRRAAHAAESAPAPPDTFQLAESGVLSRSDRTCELLSGRADGVTDATPVTRVATLRGTTACGGRVSARAAVLAGVHEADRLVRGDILVTRQTDPGWAPVFCLVSGLVIERGGMLSHGAIIAREFGLPCVVGVANATVRIPHGARLTVDADEGACHVEAAS